MKTSPMTNRRTRKTTTKSEPTWQQRSHPAFHPIRTLMPHSDSTKINSVKKPFPLPSDKLLTLARAQHHQPHPTSTKLQHHYSCQITPPINTPTNVSMEMDVETTLDANISADITSSAALDHVQTPIYQPSTGKRIRDLTNILLNPSRPIDQYLRNQNLRRIIELCMLQRIQEVGSEYPPPFFDEQPHSLMSA